MSWADDMDRNQAEHPENWPGLAWDGFGDPKSWEQQWGGELTPLKDVTGTFSGLFDSVPPEWVGGDIQMLYLYGPDPSIGRLRHWFYRIRERLFEGSRWFPEFPYPTVVLASGPARLEVEFEEPVPGVTLVSGHFTRSGEWSIDPSLTDAGGQKP